MAVDLEGLSPKELDALAQKIKQRKQKLQKRTSIAEVRKALAAEPTSKPAHSAHTGKLGAPTSCGCQPSTCAIWCATMVPKASFTSVTVAPAKRAVPEAQF